MVAIFDISTPLSPLLIRKFGTGDFPGSLNGPTGLAITGNTLYVANQFDNTVAIFDILHPTDPIHVGQVSTGLSEPIGFAITGNILYIANQGDASGVAIYDISAPTDPIFVSKFTGEEFPGALNSPTGLAITGNTLYVSNQLDDIVAIFDISAPIDPIHVDNFGTDDLSGPTGLVITGTTLSVANFNDSTIEVYDITIPTDPIRVADFDTEDLSGPQGLVIYPADPVTPPLLYVANFNDSTVEVYDINNYPVDPIRIRDFGTGVLNGSFGLAIYPTGPV
ncbi:beta-propeller fold lactonase family protein [Peribacillus sp. NJ11]|nr:beta-propeller fold lactonase family protein [Peribacillus sp. NJ11]MDM5220774.1 beta-propeller fold lactonase family protein [Peribacillus sp. NJ11]